MMSRAKNLFNFLICIIIYEKKIIIKKIEYLIFLLKKINIIIYLKFIFNREKYNPINSRKFQEYIQKNKKKWKLLEIKNKIILVENFVNHPSYTLGNAITAAYLNKIYNYRMLAVLREGDIKGEIIFRSFGIKNFTYIKKPNFFSRSKYLLKTINILKKKKTIKEFCKILYNEIEVGLSTYDTYIRYTKTPTLKKINCELIVLLADCLFYCDYFQSILSRNKNVEYSIQCETVFNPLNSFFQICLKNNIQVFSRTGIETISLRKYTDWKQRYEYLNDISQEIFENFYYNNKNKISKNFDNIYINQIKNNSFGVDSRITGLLNVNQKNLTKEEFKKKFKLDNKKIVVFFLSHLIDRNFHHGPKKNFQDNYSCINFILDLIPKLNNVNWVIKLHPTEYFYKPKFDFIEKIKLLEKNKNTILYPLEYKSSALLKIADIALTSHGTVGIEYPAFGIPSIFFENSFYSNMSFMKMQKTKHQLLNSLKNIHKLNKLDNEYILKCKAFLIIQKKLIKNECKLIPIHTIARQINEDKFWSDCIIKLKNYKLKDDNFYNMLKEQLKWKLRHTVNFSAFKIDKRVFNDY